MAINKKRLNYQPKWWLKQVKAKGPVDIRILQVRRYLQHIESTIKLLKSLKSVFQQRVSPKEQR